MVKKLARRAFLRATASAAALCGISPLAACGGGTASEAPLAAETPPTTGPAKMPRRPFGRTGAEVGIFGLGGQAALERAGQEDLSERIVGRALELGVDYVDTSAYYGGGLSEQTIGRVLSTRRADVFLATKSLARSRDDALRDLEQSLVNLRTDHVDLWQIHSLTTRADLDAVLAPGGVLEAFLQAKAEGSTRFVGISGHYDPETLTSAIETGTFDTVSMALNAADVHYRSFAQDTLPAAVAREMGVVAMKVPARGRLLRDDGIPTMRDALGYTLTYPVSTAIVGCSTVSEVEENAEIARTFEPLSTDEMERLEGLTASYSREASWFKA